MTMDEQDDCAAERPTVYLTDMSRCRPAAALADACRKHKWQLIPYEGESLRGVMLGANAAVEAPPVTLAPGVSGWHALYLGFWNPHHDYDGALRVKLKLTGAPCFRTISDPAPDIEWNRSALKEAFVEYADLGGRDLLIAQHNKGQAHKAYVAYIKLVPLSRADVETIQRDRAARDTRILYAFNDGNGLFYKGPTTREELLEEVEPYRHSDVGALVFSPACGDLVNYPSKIGTTWCDALGDSSVISSENRILHDSCKTLLERGTIPMQVLAEHAHQMGLDFHAQFRMCIQGDAPPHQVRGAGRLCWRRPDLRMLDRDGTPVEKASYAFPEVRRYMLSLIREVAEEYDIDGVNLSFIRGPQFVGYEQVVVEEFEREYGVDPRTLEEDDIRLQRHRAGYLTEFVREARRLVDEIGRRKARKIELSAGVYNGEASLCLFFGWDVITWLDEGLLDGIFLGGDIDGDVMGAIRRRHCKLIYQLYSREDPTAKGANETLQALRGFELDVDGLWYWDMNAVQDMPEYWEVLRRIGQKDAVRVFSAERPRMKQIALKTVGGTDICHVTNKGARRRGYGVPEMLYLYSGG